MLMNIWAKAQVLILKIDNQKAPLVDKKTLILMVLIVPKTRSSLARGPQNLQRKKPSFTIPQQLPFWAMIEIQADLQHEYIILIQERFAANACC